MFFQYSIELFFPIRRLPSLPLDERNPALNPLSIILCRMTQHNFIINGFTLSFFSILVKMFEWSVCWMCIIPFVFLLSDVPPCTFMRVWMYSRGVVIPCPICDPANVQTDDVPVRSASRPVLHPPSLPIVHFTPTEVGSNCYDILVLLSEIIQNCSKS